MLDSIYIKNYRNLKNLGVDSLGRVNLITGKNNTGKSTLLEAVGIFVTGCNWEFIRQLLTERGEYTREYLKKVNLDNDSIETTNIKILSSLFTDRKVDFDKNGAISLQGYGSFFSLQKKEHQSGSSTLSLRFVNYYDEIINSPHGSSIDRHILDQVNNEKNINSTGTGLETHAGNASYIIVLNEDISFPKISFSSWAYDKTQYIRTRNIDKDINGKLWDNITLTDKEIYVIEALKIIEPNTERIAFIEGFLGERSAVIKLSNNNTVVPLKSMGDGTNRILTIILALVNADNGYLLIDEFENGLHYSVQEKLWEIVFSLSQKLNIQVFVTTHSEDCITGFENVLNNIENSLEGKLIRLDNDNGVIKQVEFNAKELKIATDNDIEIR